MMIQIQMYIRIGIESSDYCEYIWIVRKSQRNLVSCRRLARHAFVERNVTCCGPQRKTAEPEC